jgi:glycosyltransferase involved in cell wall biosynthesis
MATEQCPLDPPKWLAVGTERLAPLRVALLTPVMLSGGVESWHIAMARELGKRSDVQVACVGYLGAGATWHEPTAAELAEHTAILSVAASEHARKLSSSWEILQVCAESADVLVVWSLSVDELRFLREQCGAKHIVGVSHGETDWWMAAAAPCVDRWVAVSEAARPPVPSQAVTVLENGVDVERCRATLSREAVRDAADIPRDARVIVSIGRLSPEKRSHLLAGALDRLPPDCWLWLVGDGREAERVREAAGSAADRLVISPARRDVGNVLGAADCFAFASAAEGYGLAPVEALAAGVPLASTPVGILPQLGDVAEWLPLNPTLGQVADGILASLASGRGSERVARARDIVHAEHSAEAMARRWADYLTAIVAAR